jgi:very-short-patch-repair endonuclease
MPRESADVIAAVRVGGLVDCVSALAEVGIFAFDTSLTHVRLDHEMSRMRSTRSRFIPLTDHNRSNLRLHWSPLDLSETATNFSVGIEDALGSALRCQQPWHALASIENALHQGVISRYAAERLFETAPGRVQHLRPLIDARAEAGQETVLRMIVLDAGLDCEPQVVIPGVGRVDLVVEGCLVLEADSRQAHDGWEHHLRDRQRDLLLATQHFVSLRPAYQHTMFEPQLVRSSILGLLDQSRNFRRSFS